MRTVQVNQSAGHFVDACVPILLISISNSFFVNASAMMCPGVQTFQALDAGFAIPQVKCLPILEMRERMSSHPRSPASRRLRSIRRHFVSGSGAQVLGAFLPPVAET